MLKCNLPLAHMLPQVHYRWGCEAGGNCGVRGGGGRQGGDGWWWWWDGGVKWEWGRGGGGGVGEVMLLSETRHGKAHGVLGFYWDVGRQPTPYLSTLWQCKSPCVNLNPPYPHIALPHLHSLKLLMRGGPLDSRVALYVTLCLTDTPKMQLRCAQALSCDDI